MTMPHPLKNKIITTEELVLLRREFKKQGKKVVFTNGCFDLLHSGHIRTLKAAGASGDVLIVAINSDASVRAIKGPGRPIYPQEERREILAAMEVVDYVIIFDEPDPGAAIDLLLPDVLVKGGDWAENAVIGRETVERNGGRVIRVPPRPGRSSTDIIARITRS